MERSEMIQKLNEATVLLGEMNIPAKHIDTIGIPVFAALQRICEVGTELKKREEEEKNRQREEEKNREEAEHRAEDHDQQGDGA